MEKIPRNILDAVEDIYKNSEVDPREYPGVYIYWQGCGDSGGIDDISFLSKEGLDFVKQNNYAPMRWAHDMKDVQQHWACRVQQGRYQAEPSMQVVSGDDRQGYDLDQWVYEHFDVCEINDGGFAHCFIEMPHGKVWGNSYNWVQTEELIRDDRYED